jgi:arabinose-5-phosphate isomerase
MQSICHSSAIIDEARRVLEIEARALKNLCDAVPQGFADAVKAVLQAKGRVIVVGLGKSGHIGRKIAATLASTGTPASFVQAAEASHGDLGMITKEDICLLISNSGETAELGPILDYTVRFQIPVIAISSRENSTLMRAATYGLLLPSSPEACPIGLAPTTSTTLTLALGDALAMCLMAERGFATEDFGRLHPGGRLGAQLMRVDGLMHTGSALPLVTPKTPITEVLVQMSSKGFGLVGLVENNHLIGVISDGDLRRNMADLMDATAEDIANVSPVTIAPDAPAANAVRTMNSHQITGLFVIDGDNVPIGIVHLHDCLRAGVA